MALNDTLTATAEKIKAEAAAKTATPPATPHTTKAAAIRNYTR